jgi:hypothetical protein
MRQNKLEVLNELKPRKHGEVFLSEFGFKDSATMVSHVPKQANSVVVLSTVHRDTAIDCNNNSNKPEIILTQQNQRWVSLDGSECQEMHSRMQNKNMASGALLQYG